MGRFLNWLNESEMISGEDARNQLNSIADRMARAINKFETQGINFETIGRDFKNIVNTVGEIIAKYIGRDFYQNKTWQSIYRKASQVEDVIKSHISGQNEFVPTTPDQKDIKVNVSVPKQRNVGIKNPPEQDQKLTNWIIHSIKEIEDKIRNFASFQIQ